MIQNIIQNNKVMIKGILAFAVMTAAGFLGVQNVSALSCDSNESTWWACNTCKSAHCGATWFNSSSWGDESNTLNVKPGSIDATGYIHGAVYTRDSSAEYSPTAHDVWVLSWLPEGGIPDARGDFDPVPYAASYIYNGQGNDLYRGNEGPNGSFSTHWEGSSIPFAFYVKDFLRGAQRSGNTFSRTEHIYRCYFADKGCDATPTTINVEIEQTIIPQVKHDYYRVAYQGKISLKNDDNSPLYEHGSILSSNSWPEYAGWGDENSYVDVNLYTPKESGQKLRSMYELRWQCNDWDGVCWWKNHETSYYHVDYCYYGLCNNWYTQYAYRSEIAGGETGRGNFTVGGRGGQGQVTSQKTKTINSIPYGTYQFYTENLQYTSIGMNHKDADEVLYSYIDDEGEEHVVNYATITNVGEPDNTLNATRNLTTIIRNPYNFTTSVSSAINGGNGSTVLGGSTATLQLSANIKSRTQQDSVASAEVGFPYYTKVPEDTKVTAAKFILKQDVDANSVNDLLKDRFEVNKYQVADDNICNYLNTTFGSNIVKAGDTESDNSCQTLFTEDSNSINNNIGETGWNTSANNAVANNGVSAITDEHKSFSVSIPDIEDGYKYCTVIGIKHSNSGGRDGGYLFPYSINDNWHLSNISCRTIAKVPSFQTWGNIYTSGGISTTTVKKIPDANIKTPAESQKYLFGSWSETFSLANKDIKNFGTGASLGYLNNNLGGLPIADSNNKMNYCNIVNMTIANTRCNSGIGGNAGNIVVSNEDFLNKFVAHYATTTTEQLDRVTDTVSYYKAKGNATFNDTSALADNGYRLGNGVISLNNNTLIYQVDGNLTINHNVCTGYPTERDQCNNGTNDHYIYNFYNLDNANVPYNASSDKIPQIIIIASGDINIDKSVTEIDAWLYSGGTIKTCYNGNLGDDSCGEPLIVHGPVFAKNLELHRTYGSADARRWEGNFDNDSRFFYSGAATPAEIFELRSDVYQWIYQQTSTDNKNANVRYMRELSPRY